MNPRGEPLEDSGGDRASSRRKDRLLAGMLAGLISGGGIAGGLPLFWPELYRPDPASGTELEAVERQVRALDHKLDTFLAAGPVEVRRELDEVNRKLDQVLLELARRGAEHKQQHR